MLYLLLLILPSLNLPCKVVSVHDGDTLTAEITLKVNVRLVDCWAPELRDKNGLESKAKLEELTLGKEGVLHVPLDDNLSKSFSFGRILGKLYIKDLDINEEMVRSGHAKVRP